MNTNPAHAPSKSTLKQHAKRLRARLKQQGTDITHSQSLELVAHQHGFRDWNHASAAAQETTPLAFLPGARVTGRYLGQNFAGEIIAAEPQTPAQTRITVCFDEAVDVVSFDSFSAYRRRVSAVVDKFGASEAKTSNGEPHMIVATI